MVVLEITLTCKWKVTSSINDACLCLQFLMILYPLLYISVDDLDPNCYLIFALTFHDVYLNLCLCQCEVSLGMHLHGKAPYKSVIIIINNNIESLLQWCSKWKISINVLLFGLLLNAKKKLFSCTVPNVKSSYSSIACH